MIGAVISFDRDVTEEELEHLRRVWHEARASRQRRDVLIAAGATITEYPGPKQPKAAFLRRARSRVR